MHLTTEVYSLLTPSYRIVTLKIIRNNLITCLLAEQKFIVFATLNESWGGKGYLNFL